MPSVVRSYRSTRIVWRFLAVGASCIYLATLLTVAVAEEKAENPIVAYAREQRKADEAWAKVESARLELVNLAMKHAHEDKLLAQSERQQVQLEISRIKQNETARNWALQYLGTQEAQARENQQPLSSILSSWERAKAAAKQSFLKFPERAAGAVRSGRALNFFLDLCGSTALNLSMYYQSADEQTRLLDLQIATVLRELKSDRTIPTSISNRIPDSDPTPTLLTELAQNRNLSEAIQKRLSDFDAQRQLLFQKRAILSSIGEGINISPASLNRLKFTRGQLGSKMTLTLADEPMALEWPALVQADAKYSTFLRSIETERDSALKSLKRGKRVAPDTADRLTEAVDSLYRTFEKDRLRLYQLGRGADYNASIWRTDSYLKTIRSNAAYLVSARDISDVTLTKADGVSNIRTLLTYMMEHSLRFAPSDKIEEDAYQLVFRALIDFYTDVGSLSSALVKESQDANAELSRLRVRDEALFGIGYKDTINAFSEAIGSAGKEEWAQKFNRMVERNEATLQMLNLALSAANAASNTSNRPSTNSKLPPPVRP